MQQRLRKRMNEISLPQSCGREQFAKYQLAISLLETKNARAHQKT